MTVPDHFHFGLPDVQTLEQFSIWDCYFTPSFSHPGTDGFSGLETDIDRSLSAMRKGRIQKACYFAHVGIGTTNDPDLEHLLSRQPEVVLKPLQAWPDLLIGMIQLNIQQPQKSLDAINRWIADGPMQGVYFPGGGPAAVCCMDPRAEALINRVHQLGGVIMQHTWNKTGGKQAPGESTPRELAVLAARFPEQQFICAHAGGEWEQGIRAVRHQSNVLVETSGFDATAGFIEMGVRELGAERIIFGSHLPGRSLGTELAKVVTAQISSEQKKRILGDNFRRLLNAQQY